MKHIEVPCNVGVHKTTEEEPAYESVLEVVEAYFGSASLAVKDKVHITSLPPIYLQQPGHSLTIVGLELHKDGSRNLLVLDPSFGPSTTVQELAMNKRPCVSWSDNTVQKLLMPYRRGQDQLLKYDEFETLSIIAPPGQENGSTSRCSTESV